jgi:purine-binding chemotaxis protein CheW
MTGEPRCFLIFRLMETRYAIPLLNVAEIVKPLPEFPIPRAPRFLRSVVNLHGALVPVLDLPLFLHLGESGPEKELVVLKGPEVALAITVAQVERIVTDEAIVGEEPAEGEPAVSANILLADGVVRLLAIDRLVQGVEEALGG